MTLPKIPDIGVIRLCTVLSCVLLAGTPAWGQPAGSTWEVGTPICSYYQGPGAGEGARWDQITDPGVATKLANEGFNLCWIMRQEDWAVAHAAGLRGMTQIVRYELLHSGPSTWDYLDANLTFQLQQPNAYATYVVGEPGASDFPALGQLVAYIRERAPSQLAYINLFPTYASAAALGTSGDRVTAYREYLRQFVEIVKPDLISYDHYHFYEGSVTLEPFDGSWYFLNLALVRERALIAGIPFANVVQALDQGVSWRMPNGDEARFLAFTTLAYGGLGIFQFVYNAWEGSVHSGGVVNVDRTLTPLGQALKDGIHSAFVAIGLQVQPLTSLAAYHVGVIPDGAVALPGGAAFTVDPPVPSNQARGILLGYFGTAGVTSHVLVVNLDHTQAVTTTVVGPGPLDVFNATLGTWSAASGGSRAQVSLLRGGGKLIRLAGLRE